MTHAEKVTKAQRLRAQGLTYREIGERMGGYKTSTVHGWISDPDRSLQVARKRQYAGTCEVCGGPTDGASGRAAATVCQECRNWDRESIIDSVRRWAEGHGGIPPREVDFDHADSYPSSNAVRRRFGRWNNALRAAGFGVHQDKSPERQAWIEQQLRAGVSTREIADALCVTPSAIHIRMRHRGTTVEAFRRGVAA